MKTQIDMQFLLFQNLINELDIWLIIRSNFYDDATHARFIVNQEIESCY